MKRLTFIASLGALAIAAAAPGLADPGGGHGGGQGGGHGQGGGQGGAAGGFQGDFGGVGRGHASDRAMDRANVNSSIHSSTAPMGTDIRSHRSREMGAASAMGAHAKLTGVTNGMTVVDGSGATVGTVTGVTTRGNGTVRNIQVMLTGGTVITLRSQNLSLNDGVLATNTLVGHAANRRINSQGPFHASPQGLVHASPNSVLASAGVTTLTGLATGLTVNNGAGTPIGTVDSILTNRSGAVVGINVDLVAGGTAFIRATTLTMDGTTVVTNSAQF